MAITGTELVDLAMARKGFEKHWQLARALGLTAYDSPRRVKRWRDGENEPDFEATIALLDLVGAINWAALSDRPAAAEADVLGEAKRSAEAARELDSHSRSGRRLPRRGAA